MRPPSESSKRSDPGSGPASAWPVMVSAVLLSGARGGGGRGRDAALWRRAAAAYRRRTPCRDHGGLHDTRRKRRRDRRRTCGPGARPSKRRSAGWPNVIAWCCCRPARWPPERPTCDGPGRGGARGDPRGLGERRDERRKGTARSGRAGYSLCGRGNRGSDRPCRHGPAGGALARRGLARPCQCELVGRGLGLCRLPAVRRGPGDRRPGAVRAAGGGRFAGAVSEDGARRAGHGGHGRDGRNGLSGRRAGRPGQDPRARRAGRSWQSRPGSSRRGISTCTPITSTATTAAMRRSASCRAGAFSGGRSPCRTSRGWA